MAGSHEDCLGTAHTRLETVEDASSFGPRPGYSAAEISSLLEIDQPAPDDATVKQWIEEHCLEKYGQ